jgi:hypothetical protein
VSSFRISGFLAFPFTQSKNSVRFVFAGYTKDNANSGSYKEEYMEPQLEHRLYIRSVGSHQEGATTLSVLLVTGREQVGNIQNGAIMVAPCVRGHRTANKCLNLKYHSVVSGTKHTHEP